MARSSPCHLLKKLLKGELLSRSLRKPNVELVPAVGSHSDPYPPSLIPSGLNFFLEEPALLCPWLRKPRELGCSTPRDCHTLLSNNTIFFPLCLKPLVIIYLKHARTLALRHGSGNGKLRAHMCFPDPWPCIHSAVTRGGTEPFLFWLQVRQAVRAGVTLQLITAQPGRGLGKRFSKALFS